MKKLLLTLTVIALFVCVALGANDLLGKTNPTTAAAAGLDASVWEGCYGNFGVSSAAGGVQIEFDGRTVNGYSDDYLEIDLEVLKFQPSVWGDGTYSTNVVMQYAFINNNTYDLNVWNWGGYDYNGIYILTRNWDGWLQLSIDVKTDAGVTNAVSLGYAYPYEEYNKLNKIVLQKETAGYSLFIDGSEYAGDVFATLPHGFVCDGTGKTYFAYQSISPNENGTDRTFILKNILTEKPYSINDWEGSYGNYGASQVTEGVSIEFDGHVKEGFDAGAYIKADIEVVKFQESIFGESDYTAQDIMDYAIIAAAQDFGWDKAINGLYIETRSFDGKLYVKIDYTYNGQTTAVFEMTTALDAKALTEIVLIKEAAGYSLYLNGTEYGHEAMAAVPHGFNADANGKTFFAYKSYSTYGDGNGKTFILKNISVKPAHNVIYTVDGHEYKRVAVSYGAAIIAEAAPVKEGYTFGGWSAVPETMPDENVTISGTFTVNTHNLVYTVDGEVISTEEVAYGTEITAKEIPVKEGYTFSGWSTVPETMPDEDVVISGTFTKVEEPADSDSSSNDITSDVASSVAVGCTAGVGNSAGILFAISTFTCMFIKKRRN